MRVAFLTGGLEPGKDGVGDYTRLLALECDRLGVPCCIVAISDPHVDSKESGAFSSVPFLRLSKAAAWSQRVEAARNFLGRHGSTHVSIQFVLYAYHSKGIAAAVGRHLPEICGELPVQLMLHELWIGSGVGSSWKEIIIGRIQRFFVLKMIRRLRPRIVRTSNPVYCRILERQGMQAAVLPLFGHVPVPEAPDREWLYRELNASGLNIDAHTRGDAWIFGMFGTLHPVWQPEPFLPLIISAAKKHGKRIALVSAGRMGQAGEELWGTMISRYADDCTFCLLGERSPVELGDFFQFIDFGVAATPWSIIGKSGSVAAMIDHGIPVIVTRNELSFPFRWDETGISPLLVRQTVQLSEKLPLLKRQTPCLQLPGIAERFLKELASAGANQQQEFLHGARA